MLFVYLFQVAIRLFHCTETLKCTDIKPIFVSLIFLKSNFLIDHWVKDPLVIGYLCRLDTDTTGIQSFICAVLRESNVSLSDFCLSLSSRVWLTSAIYVALNIHASKSYTNGDNNQFDN